MIEFTLQDIYILTFNRFIILNIYISLITKILNCSFFFRCCCLLEQFFLRALRDETSSTGIEHSTIDSVYTQLKSICLLEGTFLLYYYKYNRYLMGNFFFYHVVY